MNNLDDLTKLKLILYKKNMMDDQTKQIIGAIQSDLLRRDTDILILRNELDAMRVHLTEHIALYDPENKQNRVWNTYVKCPHFSFPSQFNINWPLTKQRRGVQLVT